VNQYPLPTQATDASPPKDGDLISAVKRFCPSRQVDELVFCVFCVLNLSEPPLVKDPPPVPYVDITKLQQYYEILKNIRLEKFHDVKSNLEAISLIINSMRQKVSGQDTTPFLSTGDEQLQKIAFLLEQSLTAAITNADQPDSFDYDGIINKLEFFIDSISNINAATPIGTLLFTDAVSKSFANVNTCNVRNILNYTNTFKGGKQNYKKRTQKFHK
jgi:hypothetical protein